MKRILIILISCANVFAAMQYFPGNGKEVLLDKEGAIQLLTWNILGLRNDMVAVRPWEDRIEGMAELILSTGADVVILQECFEKGLSLGLYERLKGSYAHVYLHLEEKKTPMTSGLALFSKLPIAELRFTPHPDLLDSERNSNMGTLDFLLLNKNKKPVAHVAGSHFQGSSNCEWRVGLTEDGKRLSYPEVREQEARAAFALLAKPEGIPSYLCGDLNVDRRSSEYETSSLNPKVNPSVQDLLEDFGTNTSFWKHEVGLARMFSALPAKEVLKLTLAYQKFYKEKLAPFLAQEPLSRSIHVFKPTLLSELRQKLKLTAEEEQIWKYFQLSSMMAVAKEKQLWKANNNPGDSPPVSIGRLLEVSVLPVEESLDYILGTNEWAMIGHVKLLSGYDDHSFAKTLSDHHPLLAKIKVAE